MGLLVRSRGGATLEAKPLGVRLLHTSDWHLGARFYGRSLISDQAYVLDQMIHLVRDLRPDALVLSGDLFDHRRPGEEATALFHETLERLLDLGTAVLMVAGQSDDFPALHLNARWVRQQGLYLLSEPSQVLSPVSLRGARDTFSVSFWCLPYAGTSSQELPQGHPAQLGRGLVETLVQRIEPGQVHVFVGYVWVQGAGRRAELGALTAPGGQPIERRLLEYFDYAALGGRHEPLSLGVPSLRYSGSLLPTDVDGGSAERSVTLVTIEQKGSLVIDEYPLRPRRAFKVLRGGAEELLELGTEQRADDLLVLRSQDAELTVEQKARLRAVHRNVVSIEIESGTEPAPPLPDARSELLRRVSEFHEEMLGYPLSREARDALERLEETM